MIVIAVYVIIIFKPYFPDPLQLIKSSTIFLLSGRKFEIPVYGRSLPTLAFGYFAYTLYVFASCLEKQSLPKEISLY